VLPARTRALRATIRCRAGQQLTKVTASIITAKCTWRLHVLQPLLNAARAALAEGITVAPLYNYIAQAIDRRRPQIYTHPTD
jgi:hypothetical protein